MHHMEVREKEANSPVYRGITEVFIVKRILPCMKFVLPDGFKEIHTYGKGKELGYEYFSVHQAGAGQQ